MRCLRTLGVLSVTVVSLVWSMTLETTTPTRPTPQPTNHTKETTPKDTNATIITMLDVRTPPKVQSQIKEKLSSKYSIEPSHAGVAIPVDEDIVDILEESTKKMNFYKLERPTTTTITTSNGGLSTWILLSGQTSSSSTSARPVTKKPASVKPIIMKDEKNNETLMLMSDNKPAVIKRGDKPGFRPRSTTMKPSLTVTMGSGGNNGTTVRVNTFSPSTRRPSSKLTKVKASSLLQNSTKINSSTLKPPDELITTKATTATTTNSSSLPVEAKEGDQELPATTTEKKKKKTQKRKKNKNKRRKPSKASKEGDNKLKEAESAGTQLYSYLRSEILPVTVGVSLVGLLVTAGLASYYLQPFAALRRSDLISPIDRKDTEGSYYYQDDYSNAVPEEEAIGKVIAGMPENTLQGNSDYITKQPITSPVRYRQVDKRRSQIYMNPYGSVEDVKLSDRYNSNDGAGKFVVGSSVPKEAVQEVTPAVVPEHGPRNLKERKFVVGNIPKEYTPSVGASPRSLLRVRRRRRREAIPNDLENEIAPEEEVINDIKITDASIVTKIDYTTITTTISDAHQQDNDTDTDTTGMPEVIAKDITTTPHNVFSPNDRASTLFELIADLFKLKIRLGLELLQNMTNSVSSYVSRVHTKLDEHYRRAANVSRHGR